MRNHRLLLPMFLIAACAANEAVQPTAPTEPTPPAPLPKSLKKAMQGMEDDFHDIEHWLAGDLAGDLTPLADASKRVAAVMKLAYDPWEDKEVPDFGKFAHEAEAALLDVAGAAKRGDIDALHKLGENLQRQHCARCHQAVEDVRG